ncbi:hypothetical protein SAMN04488063_1726 [Halopelagius inordinatus]|uniref:DUF8162 domain-containing protein n=2 Tax=Halopelagius inordinatus TaxID=553467 RepID=A0A1I2QZD5_9EURY|nr:hypothetical protein SAMN04488063_1726 [Halopelagius inordinatus]
MAVEPLSILHTGVFLAVVYGLYGWLVAVPWAPFLLAGRVRRLFDSIPPSEWRVNYALWLPVPGAVWGFLCGCVVSLSLDVRPTGKASPLYVSGVDGIAAATAVSLLLWPTLLLYVLPNRGFDWYAEDRVPTTVLLVVAAAVWYLLWLVVPTYVLAVFAGFGDSFSAT